MKKENWCKSMISFSPCPLQRGKEILFVSKVITRSQILQCLDTQMLPAQASTCFVGALSFSCMKFYLKTFLMILCDILIVVKTRLHIHFSTDDLQFWSNWTHKVHQSFSTPREITWASVQPMRRISWTVFWKELIRISRMIQRSNANSLNRRIHHLVSRRQSKATEEDLHISFNTWHPYFHHSQDIVNMQVLITKK